MAHPDHPPVNLRVIKAYINSWDQSQVVPTTDEVISVPFPTRYPELRQLLHQRYGYSVRKVRKLIGLLFPQNQIGMFTSRNINWVRGQSQNTLQRRMEG